MKLKKKDLKLLITVLDGTNPRFTEARLRDRFLKLVLEEYKTSEGERIKICESLCVKDKDKKPVMKKIKDNNGNEVESYDFTPANLAKFEKELNILQNEEVKLKLEGDEPKRLIKLIETTKYEPKYGEAEIIDNEIIANIK